MAEVFPAFKEAIRDYLAERANNEPEFADDDICNMAVHYYLSKKIDRNGEAPIQVTISLNISYSKT